MTNAAAKSFENKSVLNGGIQFIESWCNIWRRHWVQEDLPYDYRETSNENISSYMSFKPNTSFSFTENLEWSVSWNTPSVASDVISKEETAKISLFYLRTSRTSQFMCEELSSRRSSGWYSGEGCICEM